VVVGNTQRFGVPMGFGGPHAAFFATKEEFKRVIPGRIIGVSKDTRGKRALRMALQTREQHIKREKATSNICTAQALLANMSGLYAVYHGPEGLKQIATHVHESAVNLANQLRENGVNVVHMHFFDTIRLALAPDQLTEVRHRAESHEINFHYDDDGLQISLSETVLDEDIVDILDVLKVLGKGSHPVNGASLGLPGGLIRTSEYLTHPVFQRHTTETEMMRYLKFLENRDLSLVHAMIPLGSCTMKLNAAAQLMPVSWHAFAHVHPFAPSTQTEGYRQMIIELEQYLCEITELSACSLMPNSGAQGELAGLLAIRAYHEAGGEAMRNVALIPSSAHGTNPASAVMAGMEVVVVKCDEAGNVDQEDLERRAIEYSDRLACLMITYPSTHGVFERGIRKIVDTVHRHRGLVYMDGANMNAQVGLTSPGSIQADVCHLNLHKTFAIPHGGGGPGMGPICVNDKLAPYLPKHPYADVGGTEGIHAVASAPWGSASILLISYAYIRLLGSKGVTEASEYAILNANYLASRLSEHYDILFTGPNGRVAHEFILDLRGFKEAHVAAEDVAKRLIDYGFHAPTLSFPVAGTIMIEPTESESLAELDRFCEAMIQIRMEIEEVVSGKADPANNVLVNSPHTVDQLMDANWKFPYSREKAVFPLPYLYEEHKFWPAVTRVDGAYGDRNLVCTCPPIEAYQVVDS
jgi:glycine dehydrogenase